MDVRKTAAVVLMVLLTCSFFLAGCKLGIPEITTEIVLSDITEEEWRQIGISSKPVGVSIDDFKKIYINAKITNTKEAIERTAEIPDLYTVINQFDGLRTSMGGSSEQNNIGTEDTAEWTTYAIFNSRGLSEQDIRDMFGETEVVVRCRMKNGDKIERRILMGDNMTIEKD